MPQSNLGNVLFRTIVDGAIAVDPEGRILQFNPACERMFGYAPDEIIGKSVGMLFSDQFASEPDKYIAEYLNAHAEERPQAHRYIDGVRKNGSVFPMELSIGVVNESDPPMLVFIVRDIGERVDTETRIRDSEELFRSVFEVAVDGIIIIDEKGVVELFNPACERLFGYEPNEVIGQNVKMLMPPPFRDEHDGYIESYLRTGVAKIIGTGREVQGRRKDGSVFPMGLSVGHSVTDVKRHFVGLVRDITERTAFETALHDQAEKLSQALANERTINEMQREFISIATHEFRTPLSVIDASAQRMTSVLARSDVAEEAGRRLESIRNNVRRITALIDSTLELSKAESEGFSLDVQQVDLLKLCQGVVQRQNNLVAADIVTLDTALDVLVIGADPQLIERVIENVVANAIKYSETELPVTLEIAADDDTATIHVRDQGVGISKDDQARIFERFFRVRSTSNLPGTGLGLYMCRKYMQMHGGDISVESEPGQGSVFTLVLPGRPAG